MSADARLERFAPYDPADVGEKTDLSADPKHADWLKVMMAELWARYEEVNGKR